MVISGAWHLSDGTLRPLMRGEIQTASGAWMEIYCLVDVGADRTVLSASVLKALGIPGTPAMDSLEGVGGRAEAVTVATRIRLTRETGAYVEFMGQFAAFTDAKALDMSVLGRDITNLFAVIVDRPQDVVCLLGGNHGYLVVAK